MARRTRAGCGRLQTLLVALQAMVLLVDAEPSRCRKPQASPLSALRATSSGLSISERYAEIIQCGNVSLLITRLQPNMRELDWVTVARTWSNDSAVGPGKLLPRSWHLSHNAAFVCVNETVHAFGGQYRNYTHGRGQFSRGVFHSVAVLSTSALASKGEAVSSWSPWLPHPESRRYIHWSPPTLQLQGYASSCQERRAKFAGYCEFDGKLSVVHFRGRLLLFARANLGTVGGARHVQVTSTDADLGTWSPFRLVQLPGVNAGRVDSNIYFFAVQVWHDRLLALFPAVLPGPSAAGIYASTSIDGVEWARPQLLLATPSLCSRTRVHPVRLVENRLYLLSGIDLSEPMDVPEGHDHARGATPPYLQWLHISASEQTMLGLNEPQVTFHVEDASGGLRKRHSIHAQAILNASELPRLVLHDFSSA